MREFFKALTFYTITCLAVEFADYKFVERATVSASSLGDYFSRAIANGLMDNPLSFDLTDWQADDFCENMRERLSNRR